MTNMNTELYVIGAGHMRTGTTSLKLALEKLYGQNCYHMNEMIRSHPEHVKLWIDVFDQKYLTAQMCDQLFQGYCATTDYPASLFYKDLMKIYPNAKIILTTRDSNDWVTSARNTTMSFKGSPGFLHIIFALIFGMRHTLEFRRKLFMRVFNVCIDEEYPSEEHMKLSFELFNEEVRQTVPKERLLELNVKDGWEPLCKFLNVPQPNEPFPFVNTTKEFHSKWRKMIWIPLLKFGSILMIFVGSGVFLIKRYLV